MVILIDPFYKILLVKITNYSLSVPVSINSVSKIALNPNYK